MTLRIELPAGTDYVPLPEVLRLIALALHPDDRADEPVLVSRIFRRSRRTDQGRSQCDTGVPFSGDEVALLGDIWAQEGLANIQLPKPQGMTPEEFEPYRRAVLKHGPKEWELDFSTHTPVFQVRLLRQVEVINHGEALRKALVRGEVVVCGSSRIPLPGATNVEDESLLLSVDQFANYVRQYAMEVVLQAADEHAGHAVDDTSDDAGAATAKSTSGGEEWKRRAQERAREIIARDRSKGMYPSQILIAEEIEREFRQQGVWGSKGVPLTAAYIKRRALKGIVSTGE